MHRYNSASDIVLILIEGAYKISFIIGIVLAVLKLFDVISWGWLVVSIFLWWPLIIMLGYLFYIYFVGINRL